MNVYEKLLYIQQNLKAPKGQYNEFGNYNYRSCEDIQEALKHLLAEVKVVLLLSDEIVHIGERFYVKATASLQDTESQERVTNTAYARESESKTKMDAAQITGSCSSYARKYALNGLFCIDDAKDPDTMDNSQPRQKEQQKLTGNSRKEVLAMEYQNKVICEATRTGTDISVVCQRYKVKSIAELSEEQYKRAMVAFSKMQTFPPPQDKPMNVNEEIEQYAENMPFR